MDFSAAEENISSFVQVVCYEKSTWHDNISKLKSFSEKGTPGVFLRFVQCWQIKKKNQKARRRLSVIRKITVLLDF